MIDFQYDAMIDALDDDTFAVCVDMLWPILKYKYLKREDVRRIDLKERIADKLSWFVPEPKPPIPRGKNWPGSVDKYVEAIRFYFDNGYLPVEKGSLAEKYFLRAREIINNYAKNENPQAEAENLFMCYLCLSREAFPGYKDRNVKPLKNVKCHVCVEDRKLLETLRTFPFEKEVPPMLKAVAKPEKQDYKQKNFAFLTNALMYCNLMQIQGGFGKGEDK